MTHSRRGFLGLLGAVAAEAVLDPERLLWVRGAKMISVPPVATVARQFPSFYQVQGTWHIVDPSDPESLPPGVHLLLAEVNDYNKKVHAGLPVRGRAVKSMWT